MEAKGKKTRLQPHDPVTARHEKITQADMRESPDVREIVPIAAITKKIIRLNYDEPAFFGQDLFEAIKEIVALIVRQVLQNVADVRHINRPIGEIDSFNRWRQDELDAWSNQPGNIRIGIDGVLDRAVDLVNKIAIAGTDIGHSAGGWDEGFQILGYGLPNLGPTGMSLVACVEITGVHERTAGGSKLAGCIPKKSVFRSSLARAN